MGQSAVKTTGKQRVSNTERRRKSIRKVLDAALDLFVTRGFENTSMDDVARQAGLTKGAVYFYFRDKLGLLDALLERTEGELFTPIIASITETPSTPTMRIVKLTSEFARIGAERKELALLHVLVSLQMHGRDNDVERRVQGVYQNLRRVISQILEEGRARGEFLPDIDPEYQASAIIAFIDGLLLEWHRRGAQMDGSRLARTARNMVLHGISAEPA